MSIVLVSPARLAEVAAEHHVEPHRGPHTDCLRVAGQLLVARIEAAA